MTLENQELTENQSGLDGKSTEALTLQTVEGARERGIEILSKAMKQFANGEGDVKPFVIGSKNGQIHIVECTEDDQGNIVLPEWDSPSQSDLKRKSRVVRRLLKKIEPVLLAEITGVTFVALMRKDEQRLRQMHEALKLGKSVRLENRVGCIWLIVNGEEFLL